MFDQMLDSKETNETTSNATTAPAASDMSTISSGSETQPIKKTCSDCGTSKTPLWRGGPDGPKSLCNACGIKSRKRRKAAQLGLSNTEEVNTKMKKSASSNISRENSGCEQNDLVEKKMRWDVRDQGLTWHRSTVEKKPRVVGEEEQAAVLLMAMAYSYILA